MSVRLLIRWNRESGDRAIEAVSEDASHIEVKAQSGNDDAFSLEVSVVVGAGSVLREREVEKAAEVDKARDGVDHLRGAVPEVARRDGNRLSHIDFSSLEFTGQSILDGVDLLAKPQPERASA